MDKLVQDMLHLCFCYEVKYPKETLIIGTNQILDMLRDGYTMQDINLEEQFFILIKDDVKLIVKPFWGKYGKIARDRMLNKKMIACKLIATLDIYLFYIKQDEPIKLGYCLGKADGYLSALEDEELGYKLINADVATSIVVVKEILERYKDK